MPRYLLYVIDDNYVITLQRMTYGHGMSLNSEFDQEIPQSQTADKPMINLSSGLPTK